jgi:hypothetical protein
MNLPEKDNPMLGAKNLPEAYALLHEYEKASLRLVILGGPEAVDAVRECGGGIGAMRYVCRRLEEGKTLQRAIRLYKVGVPDTFAHYTT